MKILLLGSGGREHTLAWKIVQSPLLEKLYIAPGNAGTISLGRNLALDISDFNAVKCAVLEYAIDMVVVGPEDPLVNGLHDYFLHDKEICHVHVIGPVRIGAMLEGSKAFAKNFMVKYDIPTAKFRSFTLHEFNEAVHFLKTLAPPYVLKADGLAAGKGVIILKELDEAVSSLEEMLQGKFGAASNTVVIEEFLDGIEVSFFALTDGKSYKILPHAKDYKRIGEGDTGLNTGGMGAISPVPFVDNLFIEKVEQRIVRPTISGLKNEGINYNGFLFFGLISVKGEPFVIEYNCRLGDPEAEVILPRIKNDLVELFIAVAEKRLDHMNLETDSRTVATVMLVSGGYPGSYQSRKKVTGLDLVKNSMVFHAGTKMEDQEVVTNGGRVLAVSSFGFSMAEALDHSYQSAGLIGFENKHFRSDLGFDLLPMTLTWTSQNQQEMIKGKGKNPKFKIQSSK